MADATRPYPPPPAPFVTKKHPTGVWYRVHPFDASTGNYAPDVFNASGRGNARFSPLFDPVSNRPIPTLYAADDPRGAISEIVLHDVPTPSAGYLHDIQRDYDQLLHLSSIRVAELDLVNMTTHGLQAAGLTPSDIFDGGMPDYPRTREWGLHVWQYVPKAQGLRWMSRRDNSRQVIMLFGDRLDASDVVAVSGPDPLREHEALVVEVLDDMGAGIAPWSI
jgi:hypothetical protein